jgi:hypothetical protein
MELRADDTAWVRQYRAARREPALSVHDSRVLAQAALAARGVRLRLRLLSLSAAAALVLCAILPLRPSASPPGSPDAGLLEGASQSFLMTVTESAYAPGALEER